METKKLISKAVFLGIVTLVANLAVAQSSAKKDSSFQKKSRINAILLADYAVSLDKNVDVQSGIHNIKTDSGVVNNSFTFKYIRIQGGFDLADQIDASVLVNFSELKNANADLHKVIEVASMRYKFYKEGYLNFQVGQFRPFTQIEDMYAIQLHKSFYWSNQYNGLSGSNWTSFQVGAALTGSLKKKHFPLSYYLTVWNGNGRTVTAVSSTSQTNTDNDNAKNVALRLEYEPVKDITIGLAGAETKFQGEPMRAFFADVKAKHSFNKRWEAELEMSYAKSHDVSAIMNKVGAGTPVKSVVFDDYKMDGFYAIPLIRYNAASNKAKIKSTEFTCRYDYWNQDIISDNPRTTIAPMLNFNLADNYGARLQLIGVFNHYKTPVTTANSTIYNANQVIVQMQFFF